MPPHITIMYPFLPWSDFTTTTHQSLQSLASETAAFPFQLASMAHFPGVLYLMPVPLRPFTQITQLVMQMFPRLSPYEGAISSPQPHLTVAQVSDPILFAQLDRELMVSIGSQLPIQAMAHSLSLVVNRDGRWISEAQFEFFRGTTVP